ncbi:MAG: TRAP transporter large permease subunit [Spirochaetaceae bacterium]|nr:TRAP transporter large permease subunit [Spirochaetaceae bacterium]
MTVENQERKFSVRNIENAFAIFFVLLLTLTPLVLKVLQLLKIPVMNGDNAQVNMVFMFACLAGAITWREDRHISLASLSDYFPQKLQAIIIPIRECAVVAVLTAVFFASFSTAFVAFMPDQAIWGIPLTLIFAFLPLSYFLVLARACYRRKSVLAMILGLLLGLFIAAGPISGVLYSLFGWDNLSFLYTLSDYWMALSAKLFLPLIILFIFLAILGVPLFVVLSGIAYVAFSQGGGYVDVLSLEAYNILSDKSIAAIPLFTIAGYILSQGSAGKRLVDIFKSMFGWFRGGTVIATVVVVTFFTTFTGVSSATILALGALLTMALCGSGYNKDDAQALITSSGSIGLLFPPSVAIIMYGTVNYFSVDVFDLFKGALIPGVLVAIGIITLGIIKDKNSERQAFSFDNLKFALKNGFFELLMPFVIIISYFVGIFTLMEVAAFAVLYSFILETFIRKDFTVKEALRVVAESIPITGGVLFILASARGLSYFIVDAQVPQLISDFITTFIHSKYVFLLLMNIVLLFVGCLMDIYSAILIVSPILMPIAMEFGINPVHAGVIFIMNMQIGFLTPPVGMDLFIASYAFDTPLMKVVKSVLPFLLLEFTILLLVTYCPIFTSILL